MIRRSVFAFAQKFGVGRIDSPVNRGFATLRNLKTLDTNQVPVATYSKGKGAERTTLPLDKLQTASAAIPSHDDGREAIALDRSVLPRLTPTLKSFTLEGKVAVITGWVSFLILFERYINQAFGLMKPLLRSFFTFRAFVSHVVVISLSTRRIRCSKATQQV